MAVIGKIRKHSGLLVAMVGVSLALFVLSDFLGNGNRGGSVSQSVGQIYGNDIDYADFQREIDQLIEENYTARGGNPTEQDIEQVREYAWNRRINEAMYDRQFGSWNMVITAREMEDLIFGNNIQQEILNSPLFKDSLTQQFSLAQLKKFRQQVDQIPEYRDYWVNNIEKPIRENRVVTKYFNMVTKGMYQTSLDAERDYVNNARKYKIKFVQQRYSEIADSTIQVSDAELEEWFNKNKHRKKFENYGSRKFSYVEFPLVASDYDIQSAREKAEGLKEAFVRADNDSDFVMRYSDTKNFNGDFTETAFPAEVDSLIQNSDTGDVIGPYREGDFFKLSKVRKVKFDAVFDSRHILIAYQGAMSAAPTITRTKDQARKTADSLLSAIRRGTDFEEMVTKFSSDQGSVGNGGKYLDIKKGMFAKPYEDFCVNARKGDMKVVETDFGFHIIECLGNKDKKTIASATVDVQILPLKETDREVRELAYNFYSAMKDASKFQETAQKMNLKVQEMEMNETSKSVDGTPGGRRLGQWVQRANEGDVCDPMRFNNSYVVATVTNIKEKGTPELDDIRDIVKAEVLKEKKGKLLAEKMKGAGSLDELATRLNAQVMDAEIMFSSAILPGTSGTEPRVIGTITTLKNVGDLTFPLIGSNGCYVVLLEGITEAPPIEDFTENKKNLTNGLRGRAQNDAYSALREAAKIVDHRYKFF